MRDVRIVVRRRAASTFGATALAVAALSPPAAAAVKELANDSFNGFGSVVCQVGFVEAESAAARLTADPGDYPYRVEKVRMLVCPASTGGYAVLRLYEDNGGGVTPGPLLYEEIIQITGSDDALNEVDLSSQEIIVSGGSIRVDLEWFQNGPPGIANDLDGFVPSSNYIYAWDPLFMTWDWHYANDLGVMGDWILRMEIETNVDQQPIFVDGFESGDTSFWSSASPG